MSSRRSALDALQKPQPSVGSANGTNKSRIAVLGASGYTGEEVIRLMALHPAFAATVLTGESQAGKVRKHQSCSRATFTVHIHLVLMGKAGSTW